MNLKIVDKHLQVYSCSCIPMAIELVLKLLLRVPETYYELQRAVGERRDVGFSEYSEREIAGIRFQEEFPCDRGPNFPIEDLFRRIDELIHCGDYVIISLATIRGWHMYVIYDNIEDEYRAVSKDGAQTIYCDTVKHAVRTMNGTNILTYTSVA